MVKMCKCVGLWKVMCKCVGVWKVMCKCVGVWKVRGKYGGGGYRSGQSRLRCTTTALTICHTPIPDPTLLADPNRVSKRDTELGLFFFKAELVLVGMTHIL